MIGDRGSNYTAATDAVLADAGIRTVPCNIQTPEPVDPEQCRSRAVPCPKAFPRYRNDQRIPAGRMTWTRFCAPHSSNCRVDDICARVPVDASAAPGYVQVN
jgi:hypothetical protein